MPAAKAPSRPATDASAIPRKVDKIRRAVQQAIDAGRIAPSDSDTCRIALLTFDDATVQRFSDGGTTFSGTGLDRALLDLSRRPIVPQFADVQADKRAMLTIHHFSESAKDELVKVGMTPKDFASTFEKASPAERKELLKLIAETPYTDIPSAEDLRKLGCTPEEFEKVFHLAHADDRAAMLKLAKAPLPPGDEDFRKKLHEYAVKNSQHLRNMGWSVEDFVKTWANATSSQRFALGRDMGIDLSDPPPAPKAP